MFNFQSLFIFSIIEIIFHIAPLTDPLCPINGVKWNKRSPSEKKRFIKNRFPKMSQIDIFFLQHVNLSININICSKSIRISKLL